MKIVTRNKWSDKIKITDRKYLDNFKKLIGNEFPGLIKNFDFSENRGGFEYYKC